MKLATSFARVIFVVLCFLVLLVISPTDDSSLRLLPRAQAYDLNNHAQIVETAANILTADRKFDVVRLLDAPSTQPSGKTRLELVKQGVREADLVAIATGGQLFTTHAHHPATHTGWTVVTPCPVQSSQTSAADQARTYFNRAVHLWRAGSDASAMVALGFAVHFVQDPSVPHHAAALPESTSFPIPLVCGSNGAHKKYEDWVKENYSRLENARSGGIYGFGFVLGHDDERTAYGWADHSAHTGIRYYDGLSDSTQALGRCDPLPDPNTSDNNCFNVAKVLVPFAERLTAGFINFFFESVLGVHVYDPTHNGWNFISSDPETGIPDQIIGFVKFQPTTNLDPNHVVLTVSIFDGPPGCTLTVELVTAANNALAGLAPDIGGHFGIINIVGSLTTNASGFGRIGPIAVDVRGLGNVALPREYTYAHVDLEDYSGSCLEPDGTTVTFNEYGGSGKPPGSSLPIPLNIRWLQPPGVGFTFVGGGQSD